MRWQTVTLPPTPPLPTPPFPTPQASAAQRCGSARTQHSPPINRLRLPPIRLTSPRRGLRSTTPTLRLHRHHYMFSVLLFQQKCAPSPTLPFPLPRPPPNPPRCHKRPFPLLTRQRAEGFVYLCVCLFVCLLSLSLQSEYSFTCFVC